MATPEERARAELVKAAEAGELKYVPEPIPHFAPSDVRFYIAGFVLVGTAILIGCELWMIMHLPPGQPLDVRKVLDSFGVLNAFAFTSVGAVIGYFFGKSNTNG